MASRVWGAGSMIGEETIFHSGFRNFLDNQGLAQQGRLQNSFGELSQVAAKLSNTLMYCLLNFAIHEWGGAHATLEETS
eukprot:6084352-Pyramimonas_sp.AAC.1